MTGGVRARVLSAGDAGALKLSTSIAPPSGLMITIAAFFRAGLVKAGDGVGLAFG